MVCGNFVLLKKKSLPIGIVFFYAWIYAKLCKARNFEWALPSFDSLKNRLESTSPFFYAWDIRKTTQGEKFRVGVAHKEKSILQGRYQKASWEDAM